MTTKDYVYLGLILLTALAFYCNGFYVGVYRCKKLYETMLDDEETDVDRIAMSQDGDKFLDDKDKVLAYQDDHEQELVLPKRELRGDFGNN